MSIPIAFVIHPELRHTPSSRPADLMLDETCSLADAIGLEVVHSEVIALTKLRAGSYFGKGVTERLGSLAKNFSSKIDTPVVIINTNLSPVQQRNLENQIKAKVIDRTQLILKFWRQGANPCWAAAGGISRVNLSAKPPCAQLDASRASTWWQWLFGWPR